MKKKYFEPGERVFPVFVKNVVHKEGYFVLKMSNGKFLRRRWWGRVEYTSDVFYKASRWKTVDLALKWAKQKGFI